MRYDLLIVSRFNYWDEILPAKTNFAVEAGMISKLMNEPELGLTLNRAKAIVHDIVHVAKHYTVVDTLAE